MVKRAITGIALIILMGILFFIGDIPLKVSILLLSIIGLHELYTAFSKSLEPIHWFGLVITLFYYLIIDITYINNHAFIVMIIYILILLVTMIIKNETINIIDISQAFFGFCYIPLLFSTLWLLRNEDKGALLIWLVFIGAWGSDTGAYCFGKLFGKTKLAPKLSPNKTIVGSIGGVCTAAILSLLYGFCLVNYLDLDIDPLKITVGFAFTGAIGSVFAQLGDLAASCIKRFTNVKDFGFIFPGHGGVLDRFDSILFTGPAVYLLSILLNL